jgi:DNA ligase-1
MKVQHPRLYKQSKTGTIVICDISVTGDTITVTTGQLEGAKIDHKTICEPKNMGKKNETSPHEQACLEAASKWNKKIKGGYVEDPSGEITRKLPMKVKKYQDQKANIIFPCYISPKLDGINGMFNLTRTEAGTEFELLSRGGDSRPVIPHLEEELNDIADKLKSSALNGELYIPGMHLQDISACVTKTNPDSAKLQFHIFEIADSKLTYNEKVPLFNSIDNSKYNHVKIVKALIANSHEEIDKYLEDCLKKGYEGIIIRNAGCVYEYNVRSSNAFKYKLPLDAEYKIVDYRIDKKGHPVFRCITPESDGGREFSVKIKGTDAERKRIAENADAWIGQWLKIEFENYSKDKKPLKPVGICLRECDADGNPIE